MISHEETYVEYCDSNLPPEECSWLLLEESHTVSLYEPCSSQCSAKIAIPSLLVLVESKRKMIIHLLKNKIELKTIAHSTYGSVLCQSATEFHQCFNTLVGINTRNTINILHQIEVGPKQK